MIFLVPELLSKSEFNVAKDLQRRPKGAVSAAEPKLKPRLRRWCHVHGCLQVPRGIEVEKFSGRPDNMNDTASKLRAT